MAKVEELLSGTFHEVAAKLRVIQLEKLERLQQALAAVHDLERARLVLTFHSCNRGPGRLLAGNTTEARVETDMRRERCRGGEAALLQVTPEPAPSGLRIQEAGRRWVEGGDLSNNCRSSSQVIFAPTSPITLQSRDQARFTPSLEDQCRTKVTN